MKQQNDTTRKTYYTGYNNPCPPRGTRIKPKNRCSKTYFNKPKINPTSAAEYKLLIFRPKYSASLQNNFGKFHAFALLFQFDDRNTGLPFAVLT